MDGNAGPERVFCPGLLYLPTVLQFPGQKSTCNFFLSISIPRRDPRALTNPDDSRNLSARSGQGCICAMDFGARLIGSDPKKA